MLSQLEIILAALVAVFGLATVGFVIYFIVTKCCRCIDHPSESGTAEDVERIVYQSSHGATHRAVVKPTAAGFEEPREYIKPRPCSIMPPILANRSVDADDCSDDSRLFGNMFVWKTVDSSGGTLRLQSIELEIPEGALSHRMKIGLGALCSGDRNPALPRGEALLSPVVSCQPHGLRFSKPAVLTVPHCAADAQTDWTLTTWRSETRPDEDVDWRRLDDADVDVLPRSIRLTVEHFTLYTVSGNGPDTARKWVDLVAFGPALTGQQFPIRIYCLNDYTDDEARDVKKMSKAERSQRGTEMTSPASLAFHNDGNNLRLKVVKLSPPWSLSDMTPSEQELEFEQIWGDRGANCTFLLKSAEQPTAVESSIDANQLGHDEKKQRLVVARERQVSTDDRFDPKRIESVFSPELSDKLKKMLDPDLTNNNNWVALADHLNISLTDTHWLADNYKKTSRSPTIYLLNYWVELGKNLNDFKDVMRKLERYDVLDEIEQT